MKYEMEEYYWDLSRPQYETDNHTAYSTAAQVKVFFFFLVLLF